MKTLSKRTNQGDACIWRSLLGGRAGAYSEVTWVGEVDNVVSAVVKGVKVGRAEVHANCPNGVVSTWVTVQ